MRLAEYSLIFFTLYFKCYGLNCKSEGGPKENELKKIYNDCLKQQNKTNNSNNDDLSKDWRETQRYSQWSQDNVTGNRGNARNDYGKEEKSRGGGNGMENRDTTNEYRQINRQDRKSKKKDNKMQHSDRGEDENMYSRHEIGGKQNGDNRAQTNKDVNDRNDFFQNENFGGYNNSPYSTQPSRRYKRERKVEVNSGKRSQYNPNLQRSPGTGDRYKDEGKNVSESNSTSEDDSKACVVQCIIEKLRMTDESGKPDRYMVTHTLTKDVNDEDLKDFLQESIEECFQIVDNENPDDKCEFSKNLLMCLSEKGRANCDDWKEDLQF